MGGFSTLGGVANFLGLLDTPAAYVGESLKGARVNVAEDALEFGPSWEGPTNPVWESDIIFGPAAPPAAWQDLDIGVGPCIAYLRCEGSQSMSFRIKGDTEATSGQGLLFCAPAAAKPLAYVVVVTDENGFVQWKSGGAAATLTRIAYWPDPPMPFTVLATGPSAPVAWTTLNTGIKNALVVLSVHTTEVGQWAANFRRYGETLDCTGAGICKTAASTTMRGYVMVLTDAEGRCEWKTGFGVNQYEIVLVTYIRGIVKQEVVLYHGIHPAEWIDVDTPLGKGFLYVKGFHEVGATPSSNRFRENGIGIEANGASSGGCHVISADLNRINYAFIPLDEYGTVEWRATAGDASHEYLITALAITR